MKDTPENRRKLAAAITAPAPAKPKPLEQRHLPYSMASDEERARRNHHRANEAKRLRRLEDDARRPAALKALEEIARRERGRGKQAIVIDLMNKSAVGAPTGVKTVEQIKREYAQLSSKRTDEAVETIVTVVNALGMNPYKKRRRGRSGFGISIPLPGPFRWGKSF
jgi:hypothetical protein